MKTLLITNSIISDLKPCKYSHNNYLKFYGLNSKHTKAQFMGLKNISHSDKIWVALRLMPLKSIPLVIADIAESVLYIWEREYPQDLRPRKAIEAARSGVDIEDTDIEAAHAAAHAAYVATTSAAYAAHAAAYVAYVSAAYSAHASAAAATYVANAHARVGGDVKTQEKLIRKIIIKYWRNHV